jgi:predicted CoA-substrate-specific enzyme activase
MTVQHSEKAFLGLDLGSSYTKFVVSDESGRFLYTHVIPTLSRHREQFDRTLEAIHRKFKIQSTCATGYGRNSYNGDLKKTELICAAAGVSVLHPEQKCIIDIGGEDIKIIEAAADGSVLHFYMNDKCSSGTGAFITEIAERAELELEEMSALARTSKSDRVMNSFCTVFAKTEILTWKFDGVPIEDMARGIYLSIVNRICKMPIPGELPLYLCGGVIAFHPYLKDLLSVSLGREIQVTIQPQFVVALGAAVLACREEKLYGVTGGVKNEN